MTRETRILIEKARALSAEERIEIAEAGNVKAAGPAIFVATLTADPLFVNAMHPWAHDMLA